VPVRIGIAGVGLIGGSIGLRAAEIGWPVGLFDVDAGHRRIAAERIAPRHQADSLGDLAAWSEILVLASPLDATLDALAELATGMPGPELIIDTASVQTAVALAGAGLAAFVPTHPMAGSERSGPAAARADLFCDRIWSYDDSVDAAARARAIAFIDAMGAVPLAIDNAEHDRIVALTSHLPQLVSTLLGSLLEEPLSSATARALCGTGVRSMLRLADSPYSVWHGILRENAHPVAQEVRRLAGVLTGVADALESGASGALAADFARAAATVARLNGNER
jgi:prephenate dehydrogenase